MLVGLVGGVNGKTEALKCCGGAVGELRWKTGVWKEVKKRKGQRRPTKFTPPLISEPRTH